MKDASFSESHTIANEVQVDLHMLGTLVLYRVGGEVHSAHIITIYKCGARGRSMEFLQQLAQPTGLRHTVRDRPVLCLGTGTGYGVLPLRRP